MRYLVRIVALCALAYVAILGTLVVAQRQLLYSTSDNGALAAANWVAIKGGTRLSLATADHEKLAAWYLPPKAGRPVFLFFHGKGGGLAKTKWRWQRVRKAGFGIFTFSYRGYPGSTGSPSEAGLNLDAQTAYAWLRHRHSASDIILHGLSLGTGVATTLATKVDARAIILEAPYTAIVDIAAERYPIFPVRQFFWDRFLSRERIAKINMPVLIVHGTRDTVIPFAHAKRLFIRAVEPKHFIAMQGSDHSTLVRDGLYKHVWKFLDGLPNKPKS